MESLEPDGECALWVRSKDRKLVPSSQGVTYSSIHLAVVREALALLVLDSCGT